jgi:hypothetical protein
VVAVISRAVGDPFTRVHTGGEGAVPVDTYGAWPWDPCGCGVGRGRVHGPFASRSHTVGRVTCAAQVHTGRRGFLNFGGILNRGFGGVGCQRNTQAISRKLS